MHLKLTWNDSNDPGRLWIVKEEEQEFLHDGDDDDTDDADEELSELLLFDLHLLRNQIIMMPLAPTSTELPAAHRPKIGFSIDSIVGGGGGGGSTNLSAGHRSHRSGSLTPPSPEPSSTEISAKTGSPRGDTGYHIHNHLHHHHLLNNNNHHHRPPSHGSAGSVSPPPNHRISSSSRENSVSVSNNSSTNGNNRSASVNSNTSASSTPPIQSKSPLVFSSPNQLPPPPNNDQMHHHSSPPNVQGHPPPGLPPHFAAYPPGMLNFAVQAAAAAAAQSHHHPGLPWMGPPHPHPHHPHHPGASAHPLYPWLLAKHSRLFPHRFGPGNYYCMYYFTQSWLSRLFEKMHTYIHKYSIRNSSESINKNQVLHSIWLLARALPFIFEHRVDRLIVEVN